MAADLLAEARAEATRNLGDTLFDVPAPAGRRTGRPLGGRRHRHMDTPTSDVDPIGEAARRRLQRVCRRRAEH